MSYRASYYEEPSHFEFDTKTGDLVLRLGGNYSKFDRFRSKLEGGDLEISKKEYKNKSIYDEWGRLSEHDPDPEINMDKYMNEHQSFSITMRSNAKRKFKFFAEWDARPEQVWVPDPINPVTKDRYGYERRNGKHQADWEDIKISKHTERDHRWSRKVLRNGIVYF